MSVEAQDLTPPPPNPIYRARIVGPDGAVVTSVTGTSRTVLETSMRVALENTRWDNYLEIAYTIHVVKVTK